MRVLLFLLAFSGAAFAVDVNPSKTVQPDKFADPGGKRFSIFSGDPERIQRANAIDFGAFECKLELSPATLSAAPTNGGASRSFKASFSIKNHGKKTYTLSFPNWQHYDFRVKNASGEVVYVWSADKEFAQVVGTSLLNPGDRICYSEDISLGDFSPKPQPGIYTVEAVIANYPELNGKATVAITP